MGVYVRNKTIWIDFYYRSVRCRESLEIPDTPSNRKYAKDRLGEIRSLISKKTFIYSEHFPDSDKCQLFGTPARENKTVEQLFSEWDAKSKKRLLAGHIKQSTYDNYSAETKDFKEAFSGHFISRLTKADVEDFVIEYSIGRKAKTVNNTLSTLKQIFVYAVEKDLIDSSPFEKIKQLNVDEPEINPFTKQEMMHILMTLKEKRVFPIVATLFYTGMRPGEVLAMKWENVDFNDNTYHVRESYSNNKLGTPKTKGSKRTVELDLPMIEILRQQKAKTFLRSEFIFINKYGDPYTSTGNIIRDYWKPALKKLGISYRIMYQCRHTFASLSLLAGDPPAKVSKQLGHTTQQMVWRRYAKYIKDDRKTDSRFSQMVTNWSQEESANQQMTDTKENSE